MEAMERSIRVADEAWLALALLHYEHPNRDSFSAKEILDRVKTEQASPELRPGVQVHIYLHNVANAEPNSAKYRMFYKLGDDTYRLYRPMDTAHPARKGKMIPERDELPEKYHYLLDWYEREYCSKQTATKEEDDPILQMRGVGKEIWADTNADEYVQSLRSDWYGAKHATK
ncbi:MAG: hypothetical protein WBE37_25090 [Bryobacteraceae bacterium]